MPRWAERCSTDCSKEIHQRLGWPIWGSSVQSKRRRTKRCKTWFTSGGTTALRHRRVRDLVKPCHPRSSISCPGVMEMLFSQKLCPQSLRQALRNTQAWWLWRRKSRQYAQACSTQKCLGGMSLVVGMHAALEQRVVRTTPSRAGLNPWMWSVRLISCLFQLPPSMNRRCLALDRHCLGHNHFKLKSFCSL